ncbi:MAG: putative ABC transporter permease [Clostridia bacterium]
MLEEAINGSTKEAKNIELKDKKQEKQTQKQKKPFTIFGFTITRLLAYFVIYSVIGFIIETVFGLLTKGVLESRKSFLYGPFCAIYGVGAVVMIVGLQKFNKNNYTLFFGGFLIGSIVEYVISWVGEMIFDIKWWDYSSMPFNINGRICVWFSIFWGVLAIYLMSHIHIKVDKLLDKFSPKVLKTVTIILVIFMFLDCCVTGFALRMFFTRLENENNLDLQGVNLYLKEYTQLYENPDVKKVVDTLFSDEIMLKTFPNIKVTGTDGEIIWVSDILSDIQPYYFRIFTPRVPKQAIPKEDIIK